MVQMNHSRKGVRIEIPPVGELDFFRITPARECVLKLDATCHTLLAGITPARECVLKFVVDRAVILL